MAGSAYMRSDVRQTMARLAPGLAWRLNASPIEFQARSRSLAVVGRSIRALGRLSRYETNTIDSSGLKSSRWASAVISSSGE